MSNYRNFISIILIVSFSALAYGPPKTLPDSASWGWGIQRFMKKLASGQSTKLVFVGQSITVSNNAWTHTVGDFLKSEYPNLTYDYGAESGCSAECISGMSGGGVDASVYSRIAGYTTLKNADCVLVYVYGGELGYQNLVTELKKVIPADCDIMFMGNHASLNSPYDNLYMPYYFLPDLCNRFGFGWLDIATPWTQFLKDNSIQPSALLLDEVHLKPDGQTLMGQLVKPYFIIRNVTTPPKLDAVWAVTGEKVFVRFNVKVDSISAQNPSNYTISSANVIGAQLVGDRKTVVLSTTGLKAGANTITINGVKDRETIPNTVPNLSKSFTVDMTPADWSQVDIGADLGVKGSMTHAASTSDFVVNSNGGDNIFYHKNEFHYVYKQAFGNSEIVAKVTAITPTANDCRAMLLIRDDTTCYARFASISACLKQTVPTANWQNAGVEFLSRKSWGDVIGVRRTINKPVPRWLKLTRVGDVFTGYESSDGTTWNAVGIAVTIPMSHEVTIGLGAASQGTYGKTGTATFSDVSFRTGGSGVGVLERARYNSHFKNLSISYSHNGVVFKDLPFGSKHITIYNINGQKIISTLTKNSSVNITLPKGTYTFSVKSGNEIWARSILVCR